MKEIVYKSSVSKKQLLEKIDQLEIKYKSDLANEDPIEKTEQGFKLCIESGGHGSGGLWYLAEVTEDQTGTIVKGKIETMTLTGEISRTRWYGWIGIAIAAVILCVPILILSVIFKIIDKIKGVKYKSSKEILCDYMTEKLNCVKVDKR